VSTVEFNMKVSSGNAAMVEDPVGELTNMMKEIAVQINSYYDMNQSSGKLRDTNGNTVGSWSMEIFEDE